MQVQCGFTRFKHWATTSLVRLTAVTLDSWEVIKSLGRSKQGVMRINISETWGLLQAAPSTQEYSGVFLSAWSAPWVCWWTLGSYPQCWTLGWQPPMHPSATSILCGGYIQGKGEGDPWWALGIDISNLHSYVYGTFPGTENCGSISSISHNRPTGVEVQLWKDLI